MHHGPEGDEVAARIVDVELRFMKLERFVQELSDTVADQQRVIEALTAQIRRLTERSTDAEEDPRADVPPHY